jgi:hypothetical protein
LSKIQQAGFLSDIVFDNSKITKMHDAFPHYLFSPMTLTFILSRECTPELVFSPWCLLTAALILVGFNTKTRCDLLETGYWFLELYEEPLVKVGLPLGITQKLSPDGFASLYSKDRLRDGLNTLMSLISTISESPTAVSLSHLGSDHLEHAFGQARVRCRDVNTMEKILKAFSFNLEKIPRRPFLDFLLYPYLSRLALIGQEYQGLGAINRRPVGEDQALRGTASGRSPRFHVRGRVMFSGVVYFVPYSRHLLGSICEIDLIGFYLQISSFWRP